jgi:hypothetical protein
MDYKCWPLRGFFVAAHAYMAHASTGAHVLSDRAAASKILLQCFRQCCCCHTEHKYISHLCVTALKACIQHNASSKLATAACSQCIKVLQNGSAVYIWFVEGCYCW